LTDTERCVQHVFLLWRKVQLDVNLQAPKEEGLQDAVEGGDNLLGLGSWESFLELGKVKPTVGQRRT
jgi:hypothetical protein